MATKNGQDKKTLWSTALAVLAELKLHDDGTPLRLRQPRGFDPIDTDGWAVRIGDLGKKRPGLEIWLDRFTGHKARKFQACFAGRRQQLTTLSNRVAKSLVPIRVITRAETNQEQFENGDEFLRLSEKLPPAHFGRPILEKHPSDETYFGIYDPTKQSPSKVSAHFLKLAVDFFQSVARSVPHAKPENETLDIYPRCENRKHVITHLRRERSRFLARARKIADNYVCRVCELRFEDLYGKLGKDFAEAHHLVPLSQLKGKVKTRIEDLATVCANCHRMLHQMDGERDDIKKLRAIVLKHRSKG